MKKTPGSMLGIIAAVLAGVGAIIYQFAANNMMVVTVLLAVAVVVEVLRVLALKSAGQTIQDWMPVARTVLLAAALVTSFTSQINQIGYVVAGLDSISVLTWFIVYTVAVFAAVVVSIWAGFVEN